MSKNRTLPQQIDRDRTLVRLEKLMLNGITNLTELAAAFGLSRPTLKTMVEEVERTWLENERHDAVLEREFRCKQLEQLVQKALNSYERSRQDSEEISYTFAICGVCDGSGDIKKDGVTQDCVTCGGDGKIRVESVKIKGQAGDASFLRVAKDCIVECARIKGLYPDGRSSVAIRKLISSSQEVGGAIQSKIEELYVDAPAEVLIKAMASLDELREKMGDPVPKDVNVIEGDVGP